MEKSCVKNFCTNSYKKEKKKKSRGGRRREPRAEVAPRHRTPRRSKPGPAATGIRPGGSPGTSAAPTAAELPGATAPPARRRPPAGDLTPRRRRSPAWKLAPGTARRRGSSLLLAVGRPWPARRRSPRSSDTPAPPPDLGNGNRGGR